MELESAELTARLQIAVDAYNTGRLSAAEEVSLDILRIWPQEPTALLLMGAISKSKGQLEEALSYISSSIESDQSNPLAYLNMGKILLMVGQAERAATAFQESLKRNGQIPETWFSLGNALKEIGDLQSSKSCYHKAISLDPAHYGALNNIASVLLQEETPHEAVIHLGNAISSSPQLAEAYVNMGVALRQISSTDGAIKHFEKALVINPGLSQVYVDLCCLYTDQGLYEIAKQYGLRALRLDKSIQGGIAGLFNTFSSQRKSESRFSDFVSGLSVEILRSLSVEKVVCFGDSHVGVFGDIPGFEVVHVGAATAHNLATAASKTNARQKILTHLECLDASSNAVMVCFGEVDVRANIVRRAYLEQCSIHDLCRATANRFLDFCSELQNDGFTVIMCGPYGSGSHLNTVGTACERQYASNILNSELEAEAATRGVIFFSLHSVLCDPLEKSTRLAFFEDDLHFPGHRTGAISQQVKSVFLSLLLQAINSRVDVVYNASPLFSGLSSLIGKESIFLLEIFSIDLEPRLITACDHSPDALCNALSSSSGSMAVDLSAYLPVKECIMVFSGTRVIPDLSLLTVCCVVDGSFVVVSKLSIEQSDGLSQIKVFFDPDLVVRYITFEFPEEYLDGLIKFDVLGRTLIR
jgi:tetratricopeptide (TPR) repeat protein